MPVGLFRARIRRGLGLRPRVLVILISGIVASTVLAWLLTSLQVEATLGAELKRRAEVIVQAVDASMDVSLAIEIGSNDRANQFLFGLVEGDQDLLYLLVLGAGDEVVAWAPEAQVAGLDLSTPEGRRDASAAHLAGLPDSDVVTAVVHFKRVATGSQEASQEQLLLQGLEGFGATPSGVEQTAGAKALVGMTADVQLARVGGAVRNASVLSGIVVFLMVWLGFSWLFARINRMKAHVVTVAEGDLTGRDVHRSDDEFGDLERALESITASLGHTITRVRMSLEQLDTMSANVRTAVIQIEGDAGTQAVSVSETSKAIAAMAKSSAVVGAQIHEATRSAETSAQRLREINDTVRLVSASVEELADVVGETRRHLDANTAANTQVDRAVDSLNQAAEDTASATTQIAASIQSVEHSAADAFQLSQDASSKARSGVTAVKETVEGMGEIREFATEAVASIRHLAEQVDSIRRILDVIREIAGKTNLLALNAAIIASQAGEHGRAFHVVAEEIKQLASRTGDSTQEITELIDGILNVSSRVIHAVESGAERVSVVTATTVDADRVLSEILQSSTRTGSVVQKIASAMTEQSHSAQQVNTAMQGVHTTAIGLREIVNKQTEGATQLHAGVAKMARTMERALADVKQQTQQAEEVLETIGGILSQVRRIADMNQDQQKQREQVTKTFELVEGLSQRHRQSARDLATSVEKTVTQSKELARIVEVFKL